MTSYLKHSQSKGLVQITIRFYHRLTMTALKTDPGDGFGSLVHPIKQLPGQIWTRVNALTLDPRHWRTMEASSPTVLPPLANFSLLLLISHV